MVFEEVTGFALSRDGRMTVRLSKGSDLSLPRVPRRQRCRPVRTNMASDEGLERLDVVLDGEPHDTGDQDWGVRVETLKRQRPILEYKSRR